MAKFSHDDAFPVVARLIRELSAPSGRFVPHAELVDAILRYPLGAKLTQAAVDNPDNDWSKRHWASYMVQWFSARISSESSDYARDFEREARADGYAYRPVRASESSP